MPEVFRIKGQEFGSGKPVVCVPVVERTEEGILRAARELVANGVGMLEWRMDYFERVGEVDEVCAVLRALAPCLGNTVLLCTFRSRMQGGERELPEHEYLRLNRAVAELGVADLIDLEYKALAKPGVAVADLKARGAFVILSHHDFEMTPQDASMKGILEEMWDAGADFAKLAVMPQDAHDVLRLMEAVLCVKESRPEAHLIAMAMGKEGVVSRFLGQWYASEVTFASAGKASAPGQMNFEDLSQILERLEGYL